MQNCVNFDNKLSEFFIKKQVEALSEKCSTNSCYF